MSQLKEYLDYYKSLSAPGYAVLITGRWGAGKTYQVKKALKPEERYYVSLFGLESRQEIEAALLTEANPSLSKKKFGLGWSAQKAKEVGGLYSLIGIIPNAVNSLLKLELDPEKVVVFDDLERSSLELPLLLGMINQFVEHQGLKVIVIAYDEKLSEEINSQKEKIFGQTIFIEPELITAFYVFLGEIEASNFMTSERAEAATKFLKQNRKLIFSIFEPQIVRGEADNTHIYEGNSLRVLRRSLYDVARLYSIIDSKFLNNEDAMSQLITEFCIFNLEYKMGSLPAKSLSENWGEETALRWQRRIIRGDEDTVPLSSLEILERKYSQINLDNLLLDQTILSEIIVRGHYDIGHVNECLSRSNYFYEARNLPAWRQFMNFDELDDADVEQAKNELLEQFETRKLSESGEMLHMFALRFMMSENAIITEDYPAVEQSCREYIDDLLSRGELDPRPPDWRWPDSFSFETSHGYSYWVTDAYRDNFSNVHQYLNDKRIEAFENQGPAIAEEIMYALQTDPEAFTKLISYRLGEGKFASVPVMHTIDVDNLVEAWLTLPKVSWRHIQYAFNSRYESGRLQNDERHTGELAAERDWAIELRKALETRAAALDGYKKLRITRIIPNLPREAEVG